MFPQRLRELRISKKLTSKAFGEKFSLAESTISGYETGARKPDIELVKKFADYFEVSIDYLMGGTKERSTNKTESADAPPKSNVDEAVRRIEKELGISLDNDPDIVAGIENYLLTMGKMKKKSQ